MEVVGFSYRISILLGTTPCEPAYGRFFVRYHISIRFLIAEIKESRFFVRLFPLTSTSTIVPGVTPIHIYITLIR